MTTEETKPANGQPATPKPDPAARAENRALALAPSDDGGAISAFASGRNFENAQRMAKSLATSTLVPKEYQNNLPNCLIALELASRTRASVLMVAQNLDIIHGRPSWRSTFLIATVNSSGSFTRLKFRWEGAKGSAEYGCRAVAKEIETGEECIGALITLGMAKEEGWSTKSGSKWRTMPEQMLIYRAAAFWTRVYAPELSLGMQTREEAIDTYSEDVTVTALPVAIKPGSAKALEAELLDDTPAPTPAARDYEGEAASLKQAMRDAVTSGAKVAVEKEIQAWDGPAPLADELRRFAALVTGNGDDR